MSTAPQPELKRYDLEEIRKAIGVLFADVKFGAGECVEVRVPDKKKCLVAAGWFDDVDLMAKAVARLARDGHGVKDTYRYVHENVYWTANPVSDALLSRQPKNKIDFVADASSDNNVTRRLWLPVDIDPLRPSGVSATKLEKKLALDVANALMDKLMDLGFPEACMVGGTSGNGYHILIRIDLPNDAESRDLIKKCLAAMHGLVGTGKVEIDPKVFNAARIIKSYGTMSCKGINTGDRPWRWSKLTIVPENVTVVGRELLDQLAALAPDKNVKRAIGEKKQGPWNKENTQAYIDWTGWEHGDMLSGGKSGETAKWLGTCIHDENHRDAALILHDDGWWSFSCFHSGCTGEANHRKFMEKWEEENSEKYAYPGKRGADINLLDVDTDMVGAASAEEFAAILSAPDALVERKPQAFHLTDAGNMERLVFRYGHGFRFCPQRDWYCWDGRRWVADDVGKIMRAALDTVRHIPGETDLHVGTVEDDEEKAGIIANVMKWAEASESRNHLTAMEFLSRSAKGMAASISEFDRDPWVFNCENGTVDLRSGEFCPHRQADMITNVSPVSYDSRAECPLWDEFLSDIMAGNEENITFLQRAVGYSLTGNTSEHCMFLLWGTGRNGKTTFLEVLRHVIGTYGRAANMTMFLDQKSDSIPNDLAALQGARFVSATETKDGRRLDEAKIKQITGGDTVAARFLHKEFFEFRPQFKIWLATNYRPVIRGTDEGIWRRIKLVPFMVYIPDGKKDEKLTGKLLSEASGILNWALAGLESFRRDGLMEPKDVLNATEEYRAAEDWLARFMESETATDPNGRIKARELFTRYKRWAEDSKEYVVNERRFNDAVKDHGIQSMKKDGRRLYLGIALRDHMADFGRVMMDMGEVL
jgi:P4 family phage/plasmid primase-like protien